MFQKLSKLILVNFIVFVTVLFTLNLISSLMLKIYPVIKATLEKHYGTSTRDLNRWRLPNYGDKRYAYTIFDEFRKLKTEYQAFTGWNRKPFRGETTTINQTGDRDHHPPETNNFEEKKIVRFFGGSTMWGTGTDDNSTVPAIFEELNGNYKAFNHGETAYNSRQGLARLINLYYQNESSDLVVFYDGVNDVETSCRKETHIPGHSYEQQMKQQLQNVHIGYIDGLYIVFIKYTKQFLLKVWSKLFDSFMPQDEKEWYLCASDPKRAELVASSLIRNWQIVHELVEAHGGKFIAILQPVAYIGTPRIDHVIQDLEHSDRNGLVDQYKAVYPLIRKKIKKYDYMYDFSQIFNNNTEYVYIDFCHVSQNGNEIITSHINRLVENEE